VPTYLFFPSPRRGEGGEPSGRAEGAPDGKLREPGEGLSDYQWSESPSPLPLPCGERERTQRARSSATLWFAIAALFAGAQNANAQDAVEAFYKGRQVNLIVGYGPGGGYDLTARLIARHIGRFIPGNPSIAVQNMAGAGSLRAANYLYGAAPRDGATFGVFGSDIAMVGLIGANPSVQLDPRRFTWLGSSSSFGNDAFVLIVRADAKSPSIAAAQRAGGAPIVLGGTGEGARDADVPKILHDALGLNIRQVLGYPDSPSIFLAVERGELDGRMFDFSAVKSTRPQWLAPGGGFNVLLQFARLTRHPELPDVPTARELARDADARALVEFSETPLLTMARPFAAPPGVPEDRAKALREAFLATHRDPQFLAEAAKLGIDISPVDADAIVRGIARLAQAPESVLGYMKRMMARH
jgi:tripartite-type tricarboxylate transporter receptor subunit TctC